MALISIYRYIVVVLACYFWWLGVGNGLYIGASSGVLEKWGGGLIYLTNWVLTLNLLVALDSSFFATRKKNRPLQIIYPAALAMNFVIIALYWGMRILDQSLLDVNTENWTFREWAWDFYLHWGMTIFILVELVFFTNIIKNFIKTYAALLLIFFGYIFWIEAFISKFNNSPCGKLTCGFPYPFLNDLDVKGRIIFYLGVFILGTVSFLFARILININKFKFVSS